MTVPAAPIPAPIPDWPCQPILHAPWQAVTRGEAGRALELLDAHQNREGLHRICLTHDVLAMRGLALPFYGGERLYEAMLRPRDGGPVMILPFLVPGAMTALNGAAREDTGDGSVTVLNFTSAPIHARNEGRLHLDSLEDAQAYLRFFCAYVWGDEGGFWVVDDLDRLPWRADQDEAARRDLLGQAAGRIGPATIRPAAEDGFEAHIVVCYGAALFAADMHITASGSIEMTDDDPLVENPLPMVPDRREGPFRLLEEETTP